MLRQVNFQFSQIVSPRLICDDGIDGAVLLRVAYRIHSVIGLQESKGMSIPIKNGNVIKSYFFLADARSPS